MENYEKYTENGFDTDEAPFYHSQDQKPESTFTVRDGPSFPHYRLVTICLGPLSALLLVVAIVLGVYLILGPSLIPTGNKVSESHLPLYQNLTQISSELEQLRAVRNNVIHAKEEAQRKLHRELTSLHQLEIALQQQTTSNDNFQAQIESLRKDKPQLQSQISSLEISCGLCLPGWDLLNSTCYYFAISDAIESRSWGEARKECLSYGADLVVVDSWEKQEFMSKVIQALRYSSIVRYNTGFWIGLKEEEDIEGTWTWLDGTELTQGYWADGEPNDDKKAEDCAAIYSKTHPRKTWNDAPCTHALKWICEMKARAAQELKL
ncbi:C-type lectin domain family 10 member A isoform X1 [Salmo salar]|uniref:C-type lectin domain family 10 member A isoform X1 n=1 Tax=Salmo salar TaxID=8030 RepID=A0ABM3F802_SALSA|nr:C-type lectin domain family 10 member A isoform X1 [Salmo salar]